MRRQIIDEAMTWLRTPWHHGARVKGAGVDCAQFLVAVYVAVGVVEEPTLEAYPRDWHLHRDEAKFLKYLLQYAEPVSDPKPGDIAMFKYGRHAAHGAIVLGDNRIIHAWTDEGMVTITDLGVSPLADRLHGYYRIKGLE